MEYACNYVAKVTWADAVEVVVSFIRQVPGECGRVNCRGGGGVGAQRKPPMEQILLLHPDNVLVLCREGMAEGGGGFN